MPLSNEKQEFEEYETTPNPVELTSQSEKPFNPEKSKVKCICPMCGKKHTMNIYWIGRGAPRKYCQNCKGSL